MKPTNETLFKSCFLAYLAILPVANTIALRNLLLFVLLLILLVWGLGQRRQLPSGAKILKWFPRPLLLWAVFLVFFPFWAAEPEVALMNLKGQWGVSLAAWTVGMGGALMLGKRGPGLWSLGMASAFLVGVHLTMTTMAWAGLFGHEVPSSLPVSQMWNSMLSTFGFQDGADWHWQPFPWGFRGFDPMYGNLGYTASQAIALFLTCLVLGLSMHKAGWAWKAALAIVICFLSIVTANSRGAVLYSLLLVVLGGVVFLVRRSRQANHIGTAMRRPSLYFGATIVMGVVLSFVLELSVSKDPRWHTMLDKAYAGFLVNDPVAFMCNGLSEQDRERLDKVFEAKDAIARKQILDSLDDGDGGRVLLMRVGLQLVLENPYGIDGGRGSYKSVIRKKCGHEPAVTYAHQHQSWMDIALGLGWPGAALFAWLLFSFVYAGWKHWDDDNVQPWAIAMLLLSVFWISRGIVDSLYREHYLQMQALVLGYLWARMKLEIKNTDE